MDTETDTANTCPIGEPSCSIIDQNRQLRAETQRLHQDLRTDILTGLFNYRHFSEALEIEMERTQRSHAPPPHYWFWISIFSKRSTTPGDTRWVTRRCNTSPV